MFLALWVVAIAAAVVPWADVQTHSHWPRVQWIPFFTPPIRPLDLVINVLLYAPLGFWFVRQSADDDTRAWWRACIYAMALSLFTEWTQLYSHSRFPSLTDTSCNLIGTALGALMAVRGYARVAGEVPLEGGIS
jgi:VanZ family protein